MKLFLNQKIIFTIDESIDIMVRFSHDRSSLSEPPKKLDPDKKNYLMTLNPGSVSDLRSKLTLQLKNSKTSLKENILYLVFDIAMRSEKDLNERERWEPVLNKLVLELQQGTKRLSRKRVEYHSQELHNLKMLEEFKRLLGYQKNEEKLKQILKTVEFYRNRSLYNKPVNAERLHVDIENQDLIERINYWVLPEGRDPHNMEKLTHHVRFSPENSNVPVKNPDRHALAQKKAFFKDREKIIEYIKQMKNIMSSPQQYQKKYTYQKISRLLNDLSARRHPLFVSKDLKNAKRKNGEPLNYTLRFSAAQALERALKKWKKGQFSGSKRYLGEALKALALRLQEIESYGYYKSQVAQYYAEQIRMQDPLYAMAFYWLPAILKNTENDLFKYRSLTMLIIDLLKKPVFTELKDLENVLNLLIRKIYYVYSAKIQYAELVKLIFSFKLKRQHQFISMKDEIKKARYAFSIYDIESYENHINDFVKKSHDKKWYKRDLSEAVDKMQAIIHDLKQNPLVKNYPNTKKVAGGRSKLDETSLNLYLLAQKELLVQAMQSLRDLIRHKNKEALEQFHAQTEKNEKTE